jgi:hypothetical protein
MSQMVDQRLDYLTDSLHSLSLGVSKWGLCGLAMSGNVDDDSQAPDPLPAISRSILFDQGISGAKPKVLASPRHLRP